VSLLIFGFGEHEKEGGSPKTQTNARVASARSFSPLSLLLSVVLIRLAAKGHGMQHPRCRRRSHLFIDVLNIARA